MPFSFAAVIALLERIGIRELWKVAFWVLRKSNRQIRRLLFYIGLSARSKQRRRMRGRRAKMTLSVLVNLDKSFYILGGAIS